METRDLVIVLFAMAATSMNSIMTRLAYRSEVEAISFAICTLVTTLVFFWIISSVLHKGKAMRLSGQDWRKLLYLGVLSTAVAVNLYYIGLKFTTAINTAFIVRMQTPFMVMFAFFMIGERITRRQGLALAAMFAGAYLLIVKGLAFSLNLGDLFILAAAFLWGYTNIYFKKALSHLPITLTLFVRFLIGAALVVGVAFLTLGTDFLSAFAVVPHWVVATAFCYSVYIYGLYHGIDRIGASLTGIVMLAAPLITTVLAFFVLGETFVAIQYVGAALILVGSYILIKKQRGKN